ncbi:hypothetical protein J6590_003536 [Homalodisca vitripennis]|nr:hypothetical protein J6590_003536 [Homalodisca vitripennis]
MRSLTPPTPPTGYRPQSLGSDYSLAPDGEVAAQTNKDVTKTFPLLVLSYCPGCPAALRGHVNWPFHLNKQTGCRNIENMRDRHVLILLMVHSYVDQIAANVCRGHFVTWTTVAAAAPKSDRPSRKVGYCKMDEVNKRANEQLITRHISSDKPGCE